jgi:Protein of unknown function (DUF2612)
MTQYLGKTVQKEYSNSATLLALLADFDQWVDLAAFSDEFLAYVWDIDTAQGFGLDILGRILGQSRYLQIEQSPNNNFGFNIGAGPGTQWQPWSQAPFYGGQAAGTVSFALQDEYYRKLLLVKAAANIATCDVPTINSLMRAMFGDRGRCYVGYDPAVPMHIGYHFEFFPTPVEKSIIQSGIFPQPAGTIATFIYEVIDYAPFGFAGMNTGADPKYVTGWSQGPFYEPGAPGGNMLNNIGGTFILDQSQLG